MIRYDKIHVAYFSMEIGINNKIPTYSGGLGILAGDTLRSATDLEVPMLGITLLYKKGYFKQTIDNQGNQTEEEVKWNPLKVLDSLPQEVSVQIEGREVKVRAWLYKIMGVTGFENPLIFLDTDVTGNSEYDKKITHHLYGNDNKYRLAQEIILGIGGVKMVDKLNCTNIEKYHMNEGHSALLTLELYKRSLQEDKIHDVRGKCVFTTHTPVPAGHDQFSKDLAIQMLGDQFPHEIENEVLYNDTLNMTHIGLRFSRYVNGVAKKHGEVSRTMFPEYQIDSITNGIHASFWACEPMRLLFNKYITGWEIDPFNLRYVLSIPSQEVWNAHLEAKRNLFYQVKKRYDIDMDENILTIGFARRAATYKRGDMLFSDTEKLMRIAEEGGGLQIIYAGKAHPADWEGKQVIKRIREHMNAVSKNIKVCYIEDYDIDVAKILIPGVDLWLNTPMRPKEASGTSGMKAAANGVPHFSVLDGWWLEGYITNITGWSIGVHPDKMTQSVHKDDCEDMYTKLEYLIMPTFYKERDDWIECMKHSIAINGSFFNTHRMVQQYVLNAYFK